MRFFSNRAPAEQQEDEVPSIDTLFDEVDKPKLDAEVFELFKTMEVSEALCSSGRGTTIMPLPGSATGEIAWHEWRGFD